MKRRRISPAARAARPGGALRRLAGVLALTLLLGAMAPGGTNAQPGADIPWRDDVLYSRTSVEDDIRSVLRSILQSSGLSAYFRPGVQGSVSFRFDDVLPRHAFEQLMIEQGLGYEYNPATRTVTIFADSLDAAQAPRREFVTLAYSGFPAISTMLRRFGIGLDGIDYDAATRTVMIEGRPERIAEVTGLIARVEDAAAVRRQQAEEFAQKEQAQRRAEIEQQIYQQMLDADVQVIPLRFASVGATTRQFHGRTITVPGIEQTLQAMLGRLNVDGRGQSGVLNALDAGTDQETDQQFYHRMQALSQPVVSVDPRTNSVIVRGTPSGIAAVEKVVRELDQPLKMVEIEVIIATAQVGVAEELGVAIRSSVTGQAGANKSGAFDSGSSGGVINNDNNSLFDSNGLNALSLLPAAASPTASVASFVINGAGNILQLQLNALEEQNKAQVLSAPRLVTLDNITARITRAQDLFVQVDTGGDNGQSLAEIQTGLTLEITPSLIPSTTDDTKNLIRLSINAVNSAPGAGVFGQIDVNSQEVQTEVLVPNGGTYVVGGLFDDDRLEQDSGIPGLKDLPVVGFLFGNELSTNNLSETIFFITPRIIEEDAPFARDIAERMGTPAYLARQRQRLSNAANDLMQGTGSVFPNAVRMLEEDE